MKAYICLVLLMFNSSIICNNLTPLRFDSSLSRNGVSKLLELAAKIRCSLQDLVVASDYLLSFEFELRMLKKSEIHMVLQNDLAYLADLMFDIQNKFDNEHSGVDHEQIVVINYLFNKIQNGLLPNELYADTAT